MGLVVQCDKCDVVEEDMHAVQLGHGMAKGGMSMVGGAHICKSCWPQWKSDLDKITRFFKMERHGQGPDIAQARMVPPDMKLGPM